jgi:tRNA threonylcarbamoyladenosine biosynthesis protein TsaE
MHQKIVINSESELSIATKELYNIINAHKKPLIVFLNGDLGAGKTTFVKFLMQHFCYEDLVTSPTFNIHQIYTCKNDIINHFDLYRLDSEDELYNIGFYDIICRDINIIEWPDKAVGIDPDIIVDIKILSEASREIMLKY